MLAYKEGVSPHYEKPACRNKDCTIPEIIGYIEPNPQVGPGGSPSDETNPPKIQGMSTESTTTTEEGVVYDVRFSPPSPGRTGKIGLIINTQAQSKYHPGYPLVKRAIYPWADAGLPIRVRVHSNPTTGNSEGIFHLDFHPAA